MPTEAELVERNMGLMRWAIRQAAPGHDAGEFLGVAYEAIVRCVGKHDPAVAPWFAYASRAVINAVVTELRREARKGRRTVAIGDRDHAGGDGCPLELLAARDDMRQLADAILRIGEERGSRRGHVAALMARGVTLRRIGPVIGCSSPSSLHKHSQTSIDDLADFMGSERSSPIDRRKGTRSKFYGSATTRLPKCKIVR